MPTIYDTIRERTTRFLALVGARPTAGTPRRATKPSSREQTLAEARKVRAERRKAARDADDDLYRALYR